MKIKFADDLTTLSVEDIDSTVTAANARLEELFALDNPTPADVAEAKELDQGIARYGAEKTARASAADEMAAMKTARAAATDKVEASDESGDSASDEPEGDEDESGEGEPEGASDEGDNDDDAENGDVEASAETDEAGTSEEKDAVTASARTKKSAREALGGTKPADGPAKTKPLTVVAAADVPGFSTGTEIPSVEALGKAISSKVNAFPKFRAPSRGLGEVQTHTEDLRTFAVAQLHKDFSPELQADNNNVMEVLDEVRKESRLPGGSLVAAGGWCAPSETLYDLPSSETTDGLIDVPEFQVKRGGIRYTRGPQFGDFYGKGFKQTEAQAIAGTTKPCVYVPCPDFDEERLDALGLCIKTNILQDAAWPELTKRFVSGALTGWQHWRSADIINRMVTIAGAARAVGNVGSVGVNALNALELVIEEKREKYRLARNATMEAVAPNWLKGAIRADYAMRTGIDLLNVTDQMIDAHFKSRGARVQWVYNWQMLTEGEEGYPATVNILVYPAGTYAVGVADVINLSAVYDAASLTVNEYTGLFFEEGLLVVSQEFDASLLTINVETAGNTGAADNTASFTLVP